MNLKTLETIESVRVPREISLEFIFFRGCVPCKIRTMRQNFESLIKLGWQTVQNSHVYYFQLLKNQPAAIFGKYIIQSTDNTE